MNWWWNRLGRTTLSMRLWTAHIEGINITVRQHTFWSTQDICGGEDNTRHYLLECHTTTLPVHEHNSSETMTTQWHTMSHARYNLVVLIVTLTSTVFFLSRSFLLFSFFMNPIRIHWIDNWLPNRFSHLSFLPRWHYYNDAHDAIEMDKTHRSSDTHNDICEIEETINSKEDAEDNGKRVKREHYHAIATSKNESPNKAILCHQPAQ